MYRYDEHDQALVSERVEQFRDQLARYLGGELSEAEFLPLRLKNGLYVQRLAPMLRVAIPYGTLSSDQLRMLAHVARHYDKGYGHFSTRQNIQFNWPRLEEVADILADLASVQMHAIQTSGNCIRNVTTDPFAGASPDERLDPRPWCELIRQWSSLHPEFEWLPRKFKIAVNAAETDRAAIRLHDIGLEAFETDDGVCFDVYVGGGQGRTPVIGQCIRRALPARDLLTYLTAILRVYNRYGRRDNKYKARIKILVRAFGAEGFAARVEEAFDAVRDGPQTLVDEEVARVSTRFTRPDFAPAADEAPLARALGEDARFARWHARNVRDHVQPGHNSVVLSLKRAGTPPGDASDEELDAIADWAERWAYGEIRITHEQNVVLPHVRSDALPALFAEAERLGLVEANFGLLTDMICCPGGDFCSLANAKSLPVADALAERFANPERLEALGPIALNISGCMNACGHHHVGDIGILGVDKKGEEFFQVSIGGDAGAGGEAALAKILGPSFRREEIPAVVEQLTEVYVEQRSPGEPFATCVKRVGIEPFKERVYGKAA